ncbi:MAG TPA: hybrid sensor histidine kinase/response regulator [Opitutaceae bacterium]
MKTADTVLVVDDTPANLSVLVQCLGDAGLRVMVAEDGLDALEQAARTRPDLILLDVMMPGIDGFETCRRLKTQPATADTPVIFMTALADTAEKLQGFAVGAVDYITKPVQHDEAIARVRTHLELRRLRRDLDAQLALTQSFMRIAAHDLRNPLCLILMTGELARRSGDDAAAVGGYLQDIHSSAQQMRHIIDTFLQLRKPGEAAGPCERIELATIARAVAGQFKQIAARKTIELTVADASGPLLARADPTFVYQALTNYVSNALKFTPSPGTVTVRLLARSLSVRAEVQDSGPGVPAAERGRLFAEFAQLSPRPTAGEESHGVGLSVVKQLVESQGGRVGADFPEKGGSVFWFELPAAGGM